MTSIRDEFLTSRFNEFLDRYSPPRAIQNNPKAMQDEANDMLKAVVRNAPREGYAEWLDKVLGHLIESMTTRSWPTVGEVVKACKQFLSGRPDAQASMAESNAIDMLAGWFVKFRTQMPGMGRTDRTAELISRGVLANEREARHFGFDLGDDQRKRADSQPMCQAEWRRHVSVIARLKGITEAEAEAEEREIFRDSAPRRRSVSVPDKRDMPNWGVAAE